MQASDWITRNPLNRVPMDEIPVRRDAVSTPPVLGDMEGYRFTATASMRVEDLHRSIKQADVPAVMIENASGLYGIIVASQLDALLSRPFLRELIGRKPVTSLTTLLGQKPLIIAADESIPAALELALHREDRAYVPVLVRDPSGTLTLVQIDTLLRAQARILAAANREKDRSRGIHREHRPARRWGHRHPVYRWSDRVLQP